MNIASISSSNNCSARSNLFIKYANNFMSLAHNAEEPAEKAIKANSENKINKSMGIETLTIFPKEVKDGKTIITC